MSQIDKNDDARREEVVNVDGVDVDGGTAVVYYHYPCPDGAFACVAAHLALDALPFERVVYVPVSLSFGRRGAGWVEGVVDFCFERPSD